MRVLLSNSSGVPLYDQIKEQVRAQILSGELPEGEMLPSLRSLARDLRISVLTTTRAYSELEQEGYIVSQQGRGFFVMSQSSALRKEQLLREIEQHLLSAIEVAHRAGLTATELSDLLNLLHQMDDRER